MTASGFLHTLPPDYRPRLTHADLATQLRDRPGRWKRVGQYASRDGACAAASMIRTAQRPAWRKRPGGHYEAEPRTTKKRQHFVYARWVTDTTTTGGTPR